MNRYLLDTNVVSKYYFDEDAREQHPILAMTLEHVLEAELPHVSIVTTYELLRGARKLELQGRGQRKGQEVREVIANLQHVGVDWGFAAELWAHSKVNGIMLGYDDLLIVASAVGAERVLATADDKLVEALVERHVEWWPSRR